MKIEYAVPSPEKPHVLHVGLRFEKATDGVTADEIHEVPVRKSQYEKLTTAQKLAYVCECEKWHHKRDAAVRAKWDADDKAVADAVVAAAKAAEEAKFIVTPQGFVTDTTGAVVGVRVTVTHQGYVASVVIANDPANTAANALIEWQKSKDAADAAQASLNAFAVSV